MIGRPDMRSPAPRVNAENRAEVIRNDVSFTIARSEPEANFAALYLAPRFGLALQLARTVATLANFGRAFG
jgi:hypothetical protein